MSKHHRLFQSRTVESEETAEHLYELGLLTRPRTTRSASITAGNHKGKEHDPKHRQEVLRQRSAPVVDRSPVENFKQSSISAGSLGRPHSPNSGVQHSHHAGVSSPAHTQRSKSPTASTIRGGQHIPNMLDTSERSRSRRDRTFVGGECAACEELLEHTLQGERVLQFSCGHVAHEACFYEYIKDSDSQYCPTCDAPLGLDTARGGSMLDLNKLTNMVRSIAQHTEPSPRSSQTTPMPWDRQANRDDAMSSREALSTRDTLVNRNSKDTSNRDSRDSQRMRMERLGVGQTPTPTSRTQPQQPPQQLQQHHRSDSGNASSTDYASHVSQGRKHDYDVHAMETSVSGEQNESKRTIPTPIVTVRSEFPTLSRSSQQQSLTCLVTIEVPESKWRQQYDDLELSPPVPPIPPEIAQMQPRRPQRRQQRPFVPYESPEVLDELTEELRIRVDNWHGLEFSRFGTLRLNGLVRVGKDRQSWQELECYLFGEMLICVKEKKNAQSIVSETGRRLTRCTLKGSILIKKHLKQVHASPNDTVLTLNLSVAELPTFHLQFQDRMQLDTWQRALLDLHNTAPTPAPLSDYEQDTSGTDDEYDTRQHGPLRRVSSTASSFNGAKTNTTAPTEYSMSRTLVERRPIPSLHIPVDIVVVIPVSSSMQGLKITLLRDTLRFLVNNLGEHDRMGLVTFGSSSGGVPLVGMTNKNWHGWNKVLGSIRPVGQKSLRADVVEGANYAMDLLMQRKTSNPISSILLISDSSTSDTESVDFVVQRAEAAKVSIYSFGLGLTHRPDSMIELSTRTKASYVYVKDWMMLRECAAGCLGSLQSTSHQNVKLRLKLPEGSTAKFVKISGALHTTKRATGRDAEASLGDLRFGDKRDILVQLAIDPDNMEQEHAPQDAWESIVSGLEALGGGADNDNERVQSVEEVPLIQADLSYGDLLREGTVAHLPRPSLLTITMLPTSPRSRQNRPSTPPIPPHQSIVQRRMELLTSDMLTRALALVLKGQHDRAHHLLNETRTILKGLSKGGLPPLPPGASKRHSPHLKSPSPRSSTPDLERERDHSPHVDLSTPIPRAVSVDQATINALDADIEASLEWINHPAVFSRDSRKAILQAIGVISSQRAYTFRTASEILWASRVAGIKRLTEYSREWRETADDALTEE